MKPRRASAATAATAADTERAGGKEPEGITDDAGATRLDRLREQMQAAAGRVDRPKAASARDAAGGGEAGDAGSLFTPPAAQQQREGRRRRRPEPTPVQRALGLLTRREHSRKELTRKLTHRGVERDEAQAAVDKLREGGWQDDARFADSLLRSRAASGQGPIRIRAELGMHGLPREAVETVVSGYEGDWIANARDLVRRRFGQALAHDRAVQRKAAELLVRRGFAMDQIRAATRFDPDDEAW